MKRRAFLKSSTALVAAAGVAPSIPFSEPEAEATTTFFYGADGFYAFKDRSVIYPKTPATWSIGHPYSPLKIRDNPEDAWRDAQLCGRGIWKYFDEA